MRAGRFDRKIMVGNPTVEERILILKIHSVGKKIADNVDFDALARRTSGFVGADLANIINEAALKIARDERTEITNADLDYALEKNVMGLEKKIKTLKEHERNIVTYHELGHAVTAYHSPQAYPVEKISIVARGMAMGVTWFNPNEDIHLYSKARFKDQMVATLG
jgi:cell division protease FtsH